jgi:hypothetical protein
MPFASPSTRHCNGAATPLQSRCRPPPLSATSRDPPLIFSGLDLAIPQAQLAAASGKQPHPVAAPSSSDCSPRPHDQRPARQCQQQRRFACAPPAPMTFADFLSLISFRRQTRCRDRPFMPADLHSPAGCFKRPWLGHQRRNRISVFAP